MLVSCNNPASKGVDADKRLVRYLPANTTILAGVNMQSLRSSALYKRHAGELEFSRQDSAHEQFGIDPAADVSQALIAWDGGPPVLLAQGNFDRLNTRAKVTRVQSGIIAAGPPAYTDHIPGDGQIRETLRTQMEQLPHADQIWVVSDRVLPLDRMPISADMRSALSNIADNIRAFSIGLGVDDGAHLRCELTCDSDAGAKRVHDALRGLIGMARLMTPDGQLARLKLYDGIQVDQDKSMVHVHADLDANAADSAIALLHSLKKSRGPGSMNLRP